MIPLTRSRLNCYNSGVIDLSNSYQNNGNSSSSSSSGSHIHNYNGSSNRSVRPLAWNASSSGNVVQSHQLQYPKITSSSSSSSLDKPTQKQAQNYRNHDLHTTSNREASRKRKISDEEMEDVKEKQQYQSKKRDSHAGTGSGHMRKSIDSHMDDANINQPPTQSTFTPKPAPNSKPTRQPDPASRSQSTSTPSGPPALLSIEVSSRVSSTRPSSPSTSPPSSSSSQDDAAQDESGDQKSENTSSDEDGEQDEDKESDEDGELDKDGESNEDQVQSEPLQAQNGRCENGRFSNATLIEYRKYQAHFKEWCIRKRYTDGDNVTKDKFVAYAKELTAREAYEDEANPHLSISHHHFEFFAWSDRLPPYASWRSITLGVVRATSNASKNFVLVENGAASRMT